MNNIPYAYKGHQGDKVYTGFGQGFESVASVFPRCFCWGNVKCIIHRTGFVALIWSVDLNPVLGILWKKNEH